MEVYQKKHILENCSTCLYGRGYGCAHADRQKDWMRVGPVSGRCPSWWLDHNRFKQANDNLGIRGW